jgi:hypothetical protein
VWRGGVTLGLLIVLQVFVNEEVLLFTALALTAFVIAYAIMCRRALRDARHFLAGLGVAAAVSLALLAYPLCVQFTGPGSYHGQPFRPEKFVTDLLSLGAFARQSLAGNAELARGLSASVTEENTFWGPAGLVMIVVSAVLLWRRSVAARAVAIAGLVMLIMSMGPWLRVAQRQTPIPLPFGLVSHVPIIDLVSVTRFAMASATIAGVLLALATDRARELPPARRRWFRIGLVLALLPLAPKPLPVVTADPLPAFLTQGIWRQYVTADRSLVPVPLPEVTTGRAAMRWAALSGLAFPVPRGYFMGPAGPPGDLTGSWNAPHRFTSDLLWRVREYGDVPEITAADRRKITADLIYWRAAVVVLVPDSRNGPALQATLTAALGPPRLVGGVQLWDVRNLPVPPPE